MIVILTIVTFSSNLWAEEINSVSPEIPETTKEESTSTRRTLLAGSISAGILGTLLTIGTFSWWKDTGYTGWGWKDTGFFGADTYAGGSDKAGHIYACYAAAKGTKQIYEWLGVSPRGALALSTGFTFFMSNIVEVIDGFTPHDFEWADVVTNVTGLSFFYAGEKFPALDALFGLRIGYTPTPEFVKDKKNYIKLINDYSGMIFFVDFKPAGLKEAFGISPGPARYFILGITYGTYGYSPTGPIERRNLGFYTGLNIPEVLAAIFGPDSHKCIRATSTFGKYYAYPFTSVSLNRDLNHETTAVNFGVANRWQITIKD
ncbi:MAG: DUF2279 domain-containing protein [Deltaproteobacteria bacterium]|nr:MAG: DUF2279 domain-containing protein [Deltaproteobacteria bacterium]